MLQTQWYDVDDAGGATVLHVQIDNSTDSWTVVFPQTSQLPVTVACDADASRCRLADLAPCEGAHIRGGKLSAGASSCPAGSPAPSADASPMYYGLQVRPPTEKLHIKGEII